MIHELTRKNAHTELDHIFRTILPAHGMTERPEQIRLSHTMLDAMFENRIALSDAGTGIGKTYAYLTAAIVYSHSRQVDGLPFQPVIIATSSIALQNAIMREYLPFLSNALAEDPHITTPILAALRKGKSHYVCDVRLHQHLQQLPENKNAPQKHELCSLHEIFDLDETQKLSGFDRERVCVPQFCDCKHPSCRYRQHLAECSQKRYLFQICNQNLWLADCMHRESGLRPILPDACTVIVDEAHKLPETAREMFGTTLSGSEIRSMILRLKQDRYVLAADRLAASASPLMQKLAEMTEETSIEQFRDDLERTLSALFAIDRKIGSLLEPMTMRELEQLTDKIVYLLCPKTDTIRYATEDDDGKLLLCSVPADITHRMERTLWHKQIPLLLTSGTLAVGSSFRRFQEECGLLANPRVTEAIAVSPFDYAANCRLYFPQSVVHLENDSCYYAATAQEISRLVQAANGHALVLFTSYKDMSAVCEQLAQQKSHAKIFVMRRNRPQILEQFKRTPGSVLLATGAAWEGMDFPGDCVSLLIIPRLPFVFPDAIHEHKKQNYPTLRDFIQRVIVPEMQIKLKQGFGRAIRTEKDTCVVAILDERCNTRGRYRQDVLDALPKMPILTEVASVRQFLCTVKPQSYFATAA